MKTGVADAEVVCRDSGMFGKWGDPVTRKEALSSPPATADITGLGFFSGFFCSDPSLKPVQTVGPFQSAPQEFQQRWSLPCNIVSPSVFIIFISSGTPIHSETPSSVELGFIRSFLRDPSVQATLPMATTDSIFADSGVWSSLCIAPNLNG